MAKPGRIKEIEQEYGEPAMGVILRVLNEQGSIPAAARVLHISEGRLFLWCQKHGIEKRVSWVAEMEPTR